MKQIDTRSMQLINFPFDVKQHTYSTFLILFTIFCFGNKKKRHSNVLNICLRRKDKYKRIPWQKNKNCISFFVSSSIGRHFHCVILNAKIISLILKQVRYFHYILYFSECGIGHTVQTYMKILLNNSQILNHK